MIRSDYDAPQGRTLKQWEIKQLEEYAQCIRNAADLLRALAGKYAAACDQLHEAGVPSRLSPDDASTALCEMGESLVDLASLECYLDSRRSELVLR